MRGNGGRQRGGAGRGGYNGGRGGHRTYSSSSGSSGGQSNRDRPVLTSASASIGRATPPNHLSQRPSRAESSVVPVTPDLREHSEFTIGGNNIRETYTPRRSTVTTPSRTPATVTTLFTPPRTSNQGSPRSHQGPGRSPRPVTTAARTRWPLREVKIRLVGLPKTCWTKPVYDLTSQYGTVVRIAMGTTGNPDISAYVSFQLPLQRKPPEQSVFEGSSITYHNIEPPVGKIPSPVNPSTKYHEFNTILANSIDFGTRDAERSMIVMHIVHAKGKVRLTLNLGRKELDVQFPQRIGNDVRNFRFRLPIALLPHIYKDDRCSADQTALIIPFETSPQFFIQGIEGERLSNGATHTSFSRRDKLWNEWYTWLRETDILEPHVKESMQGMPVMNHKDKAIIDLGRWTSYRILIHDHLLTTPQFEEFTNALSDHGVSIRDGHDYNVRARVPSPLWTLLQEEISGTHPHLEPSSAGSGVYGLIAGQFHLAFPIRYQLEACLSNGYLREHNITAEFLQNLTALEPSQAIHLLEKVVDKQHIYYNPMDIFKIRFNGGLEKKIPNYCTLQRSVTITPTMIHVASPVMETSNRITRKYAADADRFIRVRFSDEKSEGVLRNLGNNKSVAPFNRVHRALRHGIVVAGRYYEFLAFGNSQFREHGAYFYAPTSLKSADDIRLSLGHFDHIRSVAKFGARIGQCFSTTRAMRNSVRIVTIPDIKRNGYCFTDGVGKLSLLLAQMAAEELRIPNGFDDPPSLYQFRLGGCKGVLALDPNIKGSEVHIRPSQVKFQAEYTGLEIIRCSALATPFFNRQIIIVLSHLGVSDQVLTKKQQDMVNDYEQAMTDEETAIFKLRKHIDMNQTTLIMAGMVLDGFMRTREPFMMSLLRLWRASTIKNLKEKARIAIEDGAFVLGCVDETSTLRGHLNSPQSEPYATREEKLDTLPEIFLQVDDTISGKRGQYTVIQGLCVLARNPSLHPGDLRVVRAVDVPALHHLKNVVVLPQKGDRDLANMCSGGDLDGDDYMVLWDRNLVPQVINTPPMDFTPERPLEKDEPITVSDISDFFVTYMQNDSLGQIAHAHLAQADREDEGVGSDVCLELAKLHSQAVDYPKSGTPAQMSRELRPRIWPHFMEKKHKKPDQIYKSQNILGKLYDQVQLVAFVPQWENGFDDRILKAFTVHEPLLIEARAIKVAYDESLRRLMAKHGIRTEFEAWSVFVLAHNHESRDYKFAEEFGRTMDALKAQFREKCRSRMTSSHWNHVGPFVAAMYTITAQEMEHALEECRTTKTVGGQQVPIRAMDPEHMPLISFPWLFTSELGKIATGCVRPTPSSLNRLATPHVNSGKHRSHNAETETEVGIVETDGGVTHHGEVLKLAFDGAGPQAQKGSAPLEREAGRSIPSDSSNANRRQDIPIRDQRASNLASERTPSATYESDGSQDMHQNQGQHQKEELGQK